MRRLSSVFAAVFAAVALAWAGAGQSQTVQYMNGLGTAAAVAGTNNVAICQTAGGCGAGNALVAATMSQLSTYFQSQISATAPITFSGGVIACGTFTSGAAGCVPASGGGTTNFLRADGSWAAPAGGGGTPGGSKGNIQFNNNGALGGDAGTFVVTAFGADPTDTTDSTSAIQAAETAAEAAGASGTYGGGEVVFPCGNYKVSSAITISGTHSTRWIGTCGARVYGEGPPYSGSTLTTTATSGNIVSITGSLAENGPIIENIGFIGNNNQVTCISISDVLNGAIRNSSFQACATGIDITDGGTSGDDSNWLIDNSIFYKNTTAISCEALNTTGTCNNTFQNGHAIINAGQTGINLGTNTGGVRISGWHFDCNASGGAVATAIDNSSGRVHILDNMFESCTPAVEIPPGLAGNGGRDTMILGNGFDGSYTTYTATCTTSASSKTVTCGAWSGGTPVAGYLLFQSGSNTNLPTPYVVSSPNQMGGARIIQSMSGNNPVLDADPSASASNITLTACLPVYSWPSAPSWPVVVVGNSYEQGCGATIPDGQ